MIMSSKRLNLKNIALVTALAMVAAFFALFMVRDSQMSHLGATVTPFIGSAPWLSHGDNSWMLTAATLVGLQSIPGVALYYAGLTRKKYAVNTALMVFYAFASVMVTWIIFGYNLGFGPASVSIDGYGILGTLAPTFPGWFMASQTTYGPAASTLAINK